MHKNVMRPVHPGEVIREEFMAPLGLSANALAKALNVSTPRINDVVRGRRGVSADTAMRLARYFGGDARSWLNLQTIYGWPNWRSVSESSERYPRRRRDQTIDGRD
jgi:antitoxin HigA-1